MTEAANEQEVLAREDSFTTAQLIRRLVCGASLDSVIDQHFISPGMTTTEELAALSLEELQSMPLPGALAYLNRERVMAGRLHNAILGYTQVVADELLVPRVLTMKSWWDVGEYLEPNAYRKLMESDFDLRHYPPLAHVFVQGISELRHYGTVAADKGLERQQPGWRAVIAAAETHKFTAHAKMRMLLDAIQLSADPANTLGARIEALHGATLVGDLTPADSKTAILQLARSASGYPVEQRVMNANPRKSKAIRQRWEGDAAEQSHSRQYLRDRIENAQIIFQVTFGYAALRRLLGDSPELVVPNLLAYDLREMAAYTAGTAADVPFDHEVSLGRQAHDFRVWMERVMLAKWGGAGFVDGALKLVRPRRVGHGRCPVQHAPVSPETPPEAWPSHMQALREHIRASFDVEPGFSHPPTSAEIIIATALVAAAKPYGPMDPSGDALETLIQGIPKWASYAAWQGLLRCLIP